MSVEKNEALVPAEPSEVTTLAEIENESSTSSTEESQTDVSEVTNAEVEVTTLIPPQEEEIVEEATTILPQENQSTEELQVEEQAVTTEAPVESTSEHEESESPNAEEKQEENLPKQEDEPKSSKPEEHSSSKQESHSSSKQDEQSESQYDDEGEGEDYEYDDEEGGEDSTREVEAQDSKPSTPSAEHVDDREIISVVTTKSVVNGSTVLPAPVTPSILTITEEETEIKETTTPITLEGDEERGTNATENYVVVASIQPSRSINGARFLPFPAIEQEETKQTLSELERKVHSKQQKPAEGSEEVPVVSSSSVQPPVAASTESIIDKLDRVQSELSSGLLSGKYPIISQMDSSTPATSTTAASGRFAPHIRKFQPRTTSAPSTTSSGSKLKVQHFDEGEMDELAGLLPVGFKPKGSYKNRKITTTTSTTEAPPAELAKPKPGRNSTISRSFKSGQVTVQDVALAGLLPKGYKPPRTTTTTSTTKKPDETKPSTGLESLFSEVKFDDSLAALLPKDYTSAKPEVLVVDDISKFLPPGFKANASTPSSTTPRNLPVAVPFDDLSKFLPPSYKAPKEKEQPKLPEGVTPIKIDDLSSLLPPGFKLNETAKTESDASDKIPASLLPPGYKSKKVHPASTTTTTGKPKAVASSTTEAPAVTESGGGSGLKVVFPKGFHKRLGSHRLTTPHPSQDGGAPEPPRMEDHLKW